MQRRQSHGPRESGSGFQYPRSDRAGCNSLLAWSSSSNIVLSVSSVGSSGMQLSRICVRGKLAYSFQYPRSDRAGCNAPSGSFLCRLPSLSVSSVGSSGMQLDTEDAAWDGQDSFSILGRIERDATNGPFSSQNEPETFQYPRSDRAGCNHSHTLAPTHKRCLSVSSVGSSGMQRALWSFRR